MSYTFDAVRVRDRLVEEIRRLAERQGFSRVIIGISGGKDSTVSAALCVRALGKENVFGVMMPDGEQKDISDSLRVCQALGIAYKTVNIGRIHQELRLATDQFAAPKESAECPVGKEEFFVPYHRESDVNVGPRLRMTTLRYIAQAIGARVVGTGNLSEATVGYCTKDGDTSCDFSLLGKLTSVEVVKVGLSMPELPKELVEKTPADGLSGKSDEERLGILYADIHAFIREGTCGNAAIDEKIRQKERANMHKRRMPVMLDPFEEEKV